MTTEEKTGGGGETGGKKKKREKKGKFKRRKKITVKIVATNVVASRPPNGDRLERRPLVPIYYFAHVFKVLLLYV